VHLLQERRQAIGGGRERRFQPLHTRGTAEVRARGRAQFEFRANPDSASGPTFRFEGYAATIETPFQMWDAWGDEYFETVGAGAFTRTLANACDTQFLVGHDESGLPMARTRSGTMTLSADSTGLLTVAPALDGRNPQVQQLASAMERGDVDEMSIGFIATAQAWSPDWMERRITEINLNRGDVSVVCWAANPNAAGATGSWSTTVPAAAARAAANREARTPTAPYTAKPGETNECPQCHSMNDLDAAYCDQCGTAVRSAGASAAEENETQRCPCGNWSADDAKFCDQCGQNISSDLDADNGGRGNGATTAVSEYDLWWNQRRTGAEQRATDTGINGDADDGYAAGPQEYNPAEHGPGSLVCPGCEAANGTDAKFCDQCGSGLYDTGDLIEDPLAFSRQMRVKVLALRK
jgi:hypothetical protein